MATGAASEATRTDGEIIARSVSDPGAFEAIFDRHFAAIHRYAYRRAGPSIADDVSAETFVVAFDARSRYDVTKPDARPWLYGIEANLLRHQRRAQRRQLMAYARTGVDPVWAPDLDVVDARVDARAAGPRIAAALAAIPDAERETLLLLAWADLSYQEIAEALEIPVGTVRSRLNRARTRLRELIGDTGAITGDVLVDWKGGHLHG